MKFGQQLQSESVPQWSIHNIDYNTLKEFIKVHTTRDQASAIVIPGQKDTALHQFEAEFYDELCRQHDRVGLFVATKADEIGRRLQHVADQVHRSLLGNTAAAAATCGTAALKRQRRFAKYERAVVQLREEVQSLRRFVQAQVVAFRKILKKYRKWTGSSALGARFRDNVLSDPKSFTRRDFADLESQCTDLINTLYAATPLSSSAASELSDTNGHGHGNGAFRPARLAASGQAYSSSTSTLQGLSSSAGSATQQQQQPQPQDETQQTPSSARRSPPRRSKTARTPRRVTLLATAPVQTHYWNEYDDGSENGDEGRRPSGGGSGGYALYLHPDDEADFPGMATLVSFFTVPLEKAKKWMTARGGRQGRGEGGQGQTGGGDDGRGAYDPLLARRARGGRYGATAAVAAAVDAARRFSVEEGYARDDEDERDAALLDVGEDVDVDVDEDDGEDDAFASDDNDGGGGDGRRLLFPRRGYVTHYAAATLPPIEAQRLARYRDGLLLRGLVGCNAAALVVLGVAAVLVATGRHKMRVEVDAGVITGVVASLGFACAALGLWMARTAAPSLAGRLAVWLSFAVVCVLNGAVLVLVMDNTVVPVV